MLQRYLPSIANSVATMVMLCKVFKKVIFQQFLCTLVKYAAEIARYFVKYLFKAKVKFCFCNFNYFYLLQEERYLERVQELLDIAPITASTEESDNNNNNNSSDGGDPGVSSNNRSKAALADCIQQKLRGNVSMP